MRMYDQPSHDYTALVYIKTNTHTHIHADRSSVNANQKLWHVWNSHELFAVSVQINFN